MSNIIQRLTPEEQYRLAERFRLHPPARRVIHVAKPERPTTRVPAFDDHVYEIAGQGMPPGMPLNLARKAARRRQAISEFAVYMLVVVGATTGTLIIAWALYMAVRGLVG